MESESKVGRPSKFKSEYCELVIDHMSKGLSFESFAGEIGVHRDTLYEWKDAHPEFSDAVKKAFSKCLLFWEKEGLEGLYTTTEYDEKGKPSTSKSINSTLWIFNMKNRFKWRDRQPDESEVVINNSNVSSLSEADLDAKIQEKIEKLKGKGNEG